MPHTSEEVTREERDEIIAKYVQSAVSWWNGPQEYYVVRFNLGGTRAGMATPPTKREHGRQSTTRDTRRSWRLPAARPPERCTATANPNNREPMCGAIRT